MQRDLLKRRLATRLSSATTGTSVRNQIPIDADLSPLRWNQFFDHSEDIDIHNGLATFRVYSHGLMAGQQLKESQSPLLVLLHGGGYSALSWAPFVKQIVKFCDCQVLAIDLRGHGSTRTDDDLDLSMRTLVQDVHSVLDQMFTHDSTKDESNCGHLSSTSSSSSSDQPATMADVTFCYSSPDIQPNRNVCPPLVLLGHSMGGALAVHVAHELNKNKSCSSIEYDVRAVVVIDVVEGTALAALDCMQRVLLNRPNSFSSIRSAIRWCIQSGQTKNVETARISFPGQIKSKKTDLTASDHLSDTEDTTIDMADNDGDAFNLPSNDMIVEEEDDDNEEVNEEENLDETLSQSIDKSVTCSDKDKDDEQRPVEEILNENYVWRVDLSKSAPYWQGWFQNLSTLFMSAPVQNRLLILAGMDRLDKDLTIGQMQGKFQLQVLPQAGHAIHEDVPERVAEVIAHFLVHNKHTTARQHIEPTFPCC